MNTYGTHKPVIDAIIQCLGVETVFEFGCGFESTPNLISQCKEVFSFEMQSEEWYGLVKPLQDKHDNFTLEFKVGPIFAADRLKELDRHWDLIFVDGHGASRPYCINQSFPFTNKAIVTHDTETASYGWENIAAPEGWFRLDYKHSVPWTTAFFKTKQDLEAVEKLLRSEV